MTLEEWISFENGAKAKTIDNKYSAVYLHTLAGAWPEITMLPNIVLLTDSKGVESIGRYSYDGMQSLPNNYTLCLTG